MATKKIGIIADNYKLEKFKKELTKKGFTDYSIEPFTKDTSTICVVADENRLGQIKALCQVVEMHFHRSN